MLFHCKLCKCLPHNVTSDLLVYMQCFTPIHTERAEMKPCGRGAVYMFPAEGHLGQIRNIDAPPTQSYWAPLLPISWQNCLHKHHKTELRAVDLHWYCCAYSSVVMSLVSYLRLGPLIFKLFFHSLFYLFIYSRWFGEAVERECGFFSLTAGISAELIKVKCGTLVRSKRAFTASLQTLALAPFAVFLWTIV